MEILELSHNDSITQLARKCNTNFKRMFYVLNQAMKTQGRLDMTAVTTALDTMIDVTIPHEVSTQITNADISGQVSDAVDARIPDAYPPVGSYILAQYDPSNNYPGTTWVQADNITTDGNVTIPLWQRTVI